MAADSQRDRFHITRVQPRQLTTLWTAQSYRAEVLAAIDTIRAFKDWAPLSELCRSGIGPGPHPDYSADGHPCLKTQNVGEDLIVDPTPAGWASLASLPRFTRHMVEDGDVLVNVTGAGSIGRAAVYLGNARPLTNQHLARLDPREGVDGCYLAAFLGSSVGQRAIEMGITGATGQLNLLTEHLQELPVITPMLDAQRYIGSKVRQAEALREWARSTEARFREAVALDVPDATGRGRQSRVPSGDLDLDLKPGRFTPDRLEVRRALSRSGARLVESFATIAADNVASPAPDARYLGLDGISTSSIDITLQRFAEAGVSGTCRTLPRGAAISKLRPYLNKAVFIPGGQGQVVGSTELLCVRSERVHPGYLYGVLKLNTTVRQLNPVASGATHPRVGPDEVLDLLVPWRDDHEVLGARLEQAQLAYFGARGLVTAARLLVEALIERKVPEAELIEAAKDADADRALLARLAEDGFDGTGAPLFSDLDGLAKLIAEAQRPGGDP